METKNKLDLLHLRSFFPALHNDWIYLDNAGGTQVAKHVGERINDYLYNTNVQLGASYEISEASTARVKESANQWSQLINAVSEEEIIFGSSTTQLLKNLSKSLVQTFQSGDEVIVTNTDHEANIGPWVEMEKQGIIIRVWEINRESLHLEMDDLKKLLNDKTRLVAFTHVSNILGTINPVKEIAKVVHEHGAMVCVDGVAAAPHRLPDVREMDVDFYVFSLYKVFGPHYSLLYGRREILDKLPGINHYFIEETPYKLQPGNVNYELSYALLGILDYFEELAGDSGITGNMSVQHKIAAVYDMIAQYEEELSIQLLDYLNSRKDVRVIGATNPDKELRVPTISFVSSKMKSSEIPLKTDPYLIGIRWGDFYARRLIEYLDLVKQDGVVRVSLVHYNTQEEINKLCGVFDRVL